MQESIFYQLSIVMVVATVVSMIARRLRQPLVIGYILTGILVGPSMLHVVQNHEAFDSFSQIGIVLLLFIIGLGLNVRVIKDTMKSVLLTFFTIIVGVGLLGYATSSLLDFSHKESLVMACALLFSSTIIVVKALSDKREQTRLYGQIAVGILLAEDIIATIALLVVSASGSGVSSSSDFLLLFVKGLGIAAILTIVGSKLMPRFSKMFASNQELFYVFTLAWAFGVASAFWWSGFSIEVGALFAGVAIAHLPYAQEIGTRLKPLRDFFIVLFFIRLGEELGVKNLSDAIIPALALSAIVMFSKPLLILSSLGFMGYTKQTSFKAAVHLSQISEFSIVLIVLAVSTGLAGERLVAIATMTALITIALSTYMMMYADGLYRLLRKPLSVFESSKTKKEMKALAGYPLILIGYREGGYSFVQTFREMKKPYVVIDYDPETIESLDRQHVNNLYGDATDLELLEEVGIHRSELVISTISSTETNKILASYITKANDEAIFICHAETFDVALSLYDAGASYVLMPRYVGDEHINQFIKRHGSDKDAFEKYRLKHMAALGESVAGPSQAAA